MYVGKDDYKIISLVNVYDQYWTIFFFKQNVTVCLALKIEQLESQIIESIEIDPSYCLS
jgi:hypothetical protein